MRLLSAYEDFMAHTLDAVGGPLGRLRYMLSLRELEGGLRHWGLERTYGEQAARSALLRACRKTLLSLAATPLRELAAESRQTQDVDFSELSAQIPRLLNSAAAGGRNKLLRQHVTLTCDALSSLAAARGSSHRVA